MVSLRQPGRRDVDRAVRVEVEAGDAAERRDVLVLLADRAAEPLDLDLAGLAAEVGRRDVVALHRVDGLEQPDRERAGGAQAGAGRDVGGRDDLHAGADVVGAQHLADDRVLDLVGLVDPLELAVLEEVVVGEGAVDRDVDVLGDGGRDDHAAVLLVVRRQVGAAAAQRDPQRRAGDQHALTPRRLAGTCGERARQLPAEPRVVAVELEALPEDGAGRASRACDGWASRPTAPAPRGPASRRGPSRPACRG